MSWNKNIKNHGGYEGRGAPPAPGPEGKESHPLTNSSVVISNALGALGLFLGFFLVRPNPSKSRAAWSLGSMYHLSHSSKKRDISLQSLALLVAYSSRKCGCCNTDRGNEIVRSTVGGDTLRKWFLMGKSCGRAESDHQRKRVLWLGV